MPGLLIRSSNHLWKPQYNLSTYSNILADPRNILISRAGRAEFRFKNKCEILTSGPRTYIQKARVPVVSANYFEFSTKRLENAKTTKFALFAGLILPFRPNYVQSLLKSYIKTVKQIIFSTQITFCQNIIVMLTEKQALQTFLLFGCICMGGRGQQLKMCFVLRRSCWLPPNSFFSHRGESQTTIQWPRN